MACPPGHIQIRRDTLNNWNSKNPVLLPGEFSYVIDGPRDSTECLSGGGATGPVGITGATGANTRYNTISIDGIDAFITTSNYGTFYYFSSHPTGITLPASVGGASDKGAYWLFANSSNSVSIPITNYNGTGLISGSKLAFVQGISYIVIIDVSGTTPSYQIF